MAHPTGDDRGGAGRASLRLALVLVLGLGGALIARATDARAATPTGRPGAGPRASGAPSAGRPRGRWSKTTTTETAAGCVSREGLSAVNPAGCDDWRPLGRQLGLGLGTVFLQPINQPGSPPALVGAELRGFLSWTLRPALDLRLAATGTLAVSNRGLLIPIGLQLEPLFGLTPEIFWGLSVTGGLMVGPGYKPVSTEPGLTPSPFALFQVVPFGFRFGDRGRGELGMRFGLLASKLERPDDRSWAVSFGTATVWLSYALSSRP